MTIAALRSLHEIIGHAIDEIECTYASHGQSSDSRPPSTCQTPVQTPITPEGGFEAGVYMPLAPGHTTSLSNSQAYASPPPSPSTATTSSYNLSPETCNGTGQPPPLPTDFPSLDVPCDPGSLSEVLTTHPVVLGAIGRIVAAAGQLSATVQTPFLTLCEATMGYHLPSCMRLLEASHVVEILREAGPSGLNVQVISEKNGVAPNKLAHVLRLLATHHILREVSPDVFTLNRLSSIIDSGKIFTQLKQFEIEGRPEMKYENTNGVAAFVGLCTDEVQKSAAYMTDTYYLSPSQKTREGADPARAPFCLAFDTVETGTGFFGWLEGETGPSSNGNLHIPFDEDKSLKAGHGGVFPSTLETSSRHRQNRSISECARPPPNNRQPQANLRPKRYTVAAALSLSPTPTSTESASPLVESVIEESQHTNPNKFRLERFGKAMSGTDGWEVPGAVLNGFDWTSLPRGSVVVDVGGGIGSTTMILATAFASNEDALGLKFIIQDRPVVCEMGEKAWKAKCPELLGSAVQFQVHNFFEPQPVKDAAIFLLRVVLHDWPDDFARKILLRLRSAASPDTTLLIADFVLPLACADDTSSDGVLEDVAGAESVLAPAPLLPNLGKASSNVYWMDLTMQVMFNAQERTLREMVILALSAGWKIIKVTKTPGSLFGYLIAAPVAIPEHTKDEESELASGGPVDEAPRGKVSGEDKHKAPRMAHHQCGHRGDIDIQRSSSRCGTPTFGSNMKLSSVEETLSRFGGGIMRPNGTSRSLAPPYASASRMPPLLKPALSLSSPVPKKNRPSPLTMPPKNSSPNSTPSPRRLASASPRTEQFKAYSPPTASAPRTIHRRMSSANLRPHSQYATIGPPPPLPSARQPPPSPLSPHSARTPLTWHASHCQAQLPQPAAGDILSPHSPLPSFIPVRASASTEPSSPIQSSHSRGSAPEIPPPNGFGTQAPVRVITRRASTTQLPLAQTSFRKRSGMITTSGFDTNGVDYLNGTGTVLRFDRNANTNGHSQRSMPSTRSQSHVVEGISVLDAAASIESQHFGQPSASP